MHPLKLFRNNVDPRIHLAIYSLIKKYIRNLKKRTKEKRKKEKISRKRMRTKKFKSFFQSKMSDKIKERIRYKRNSITQKWRFNILKYITKGDQHLLSVLLEGDDLLRKNNMKKRGFKVIRKIREEGEKSGLHVL